MGQDYKYNGKEEQNELSLGWLDYGARMYQPDLGRFFTKDRFATKYFSISPYSYVDNNPLLYVDITGMSLSVNGNGKIICHGKGGSTSSKKARDHVSALISGKDDIVVKNDNTKDTHGGGRGSVNINSTQIDNNIASANPATISLAP